MIYTIRSKGGRLVAVMQSSDGVIVNTHSGSGHWTWCVGRTVPAVLHWARDHFMSWEVNGDGSTWDVARKEIGPEI